MNPNNRLIRFGVLIINYTTGGFVWQRKLNAPDCFVEAQMSLRLVKRQGQVLI